MATHNTPSPKDMADNVNAVIRSAKRRGRFSKMAWLALAVAVIRLAAAPVRR